MNLNKKQVEKIKQLDPILERELEDRFDTYIDETEGSVFVLGMKYNASDVLKNVDPIAYRCELSNFLDAEIGETLYELDNEYYDLDQVNDLIEQLENEEV